jgi:hypothetical protein
MKPSPIPVAIGTSDRHGDRCHRGGGTLGDIAAVEASQRPRHHAGQARSVAADTYFGIISGKRDEQQQIAARPGWTSLMG